MDIDHNYTLNRYLEKTKNRKGRSDKPSSNSVAIGEGGRDDNGLMFCCIFSHGFKMDD